MSPASRALVSCLVALGMAGGAARADWRLFLPRSVGSGAYLDLFASAERDETRYGDRRFEWKDSFLKEKLTLFTNGYVYHPRFLQYRLSLTGALRQEDYRTSAVAGAGWRRDDGFEYDTRIYLLPEHPFQAQLFALRYEPLFKEQSATTHDNMATSRGVDFRYRKQPLFLRARYSDDRRSSDRSASQVETLTTDGEYIRRFRKGRELSVRASHAPSRFSASSGLAGTSAESVLGGVLDLGGVRFETSGTRSQRDQHDGYLTLGQLESELISWQQRVSVRLPAHFRSNLTYRYLDSRTTLPATVLGPASELSARDQDLRFELVHRLYLSLDSTYTYRDDTHTSSGGETGDRSHALAFNYSKSIPRGRVQAGLNLGRGETRSAGEAQVVNEPHFALPVPGTFQLAQPTANRESIVVVMRSPVAPYEMVRLQQDVHYTVAPLGDRFEVTILTLPAEFVVPGTYDFYVSYSLSAGTYRLRTDTLGHSASVQLFDNLLMPYYSYVEVRSDVLSGSFPGNALDSRTWTAGLALTGGGWRGRLEYQDVNWDVNPYRTWRVEAQYTGTIGALTSYYATAGWQQRRFPRGRVELAGHSLTEETQSATANLQRQFLDRTLSLAAGGAFSRTQGLYETTAYSLTSSLTWRIGKLDLTAGASAYDADTRSSTITRSGRTHVYYYFRVRRGLW
jgi:hypothetical protein